MERGVAEDEDTAEIVEPVLEVRVSDPELRLRPAARERDEQLLLAGRDAVGIDDQLKKRQADREAQPKDKLDLLIDSLDELDL